MKESKPLPKTAMVALRAINANFQRMVNDLGADALSDAGLLLAEGWSANFDSGHFERDVPDAVPPVEPPAA